MSEQLGRDRIAYWLFRDRIPATKLMIVSNAATFFLISVFDQFNILAHGGFVASRVAQAPWTLVTYPLVGVCGGPLCLIFSCFWLWFAGGSLERSWGTRGFAAFFFAMSAVSALGLALGGYATGLSVGAAGLWLPLAGVTMAFAMLNPEQEILFFFMFPLKLKYLALLDVGIVLASYGQIHIVVGLFALTGCAFSYWYVGGPRPIWRRAIHAEKSRVTRVRPKSGFVSRLSPFAWLKAARDRRRLRKLFESSGIDEDSAR